MPRQTLEERTDGRYSCKYKDKYFYGKTPAEALKKRDGHDPADVGNLISGSSAFSKTSLNIRNFTVHILLKPGLENFYLVSEPNEAQVLDVSS